jgi:hypothetical protein
MNIEDDLSLLSLSGEELYELEKQKRDWEDGNARGRYTKTGRPLREENLQEPLGNIMEGLEHSLENLLDKEYLATRISSPRVRGRKPSGTFEITFQSPNSGPLNSRIGYKAFPSPSERIENQEDLTDARTGMKIEGSGIADDIWGAEPKPDKWEYDSEEPYLEARWENLE